MLLCMRTSERLSNDSILAAIREYCDENGMTVTQFGVEIANNPALVTRLKRGADLNLSTVRAIFDKIEG